MNINNENMTFFWHRYNRTFNECELSLKISNLETETDL